MLFGMDTPSSADQGPAERKARDQYQPPTLTTLGTIQELTQGIVPSGTDLFAPGSAFPEGTR